VPKDPPQEDFFSDIFNEIDDIEVQSGTQFSGNETSLKVNYDDDLLTIQTESINDIQTLNVTFNYSVSDYENNFANYPIDYHDLYLYLSLEPGNSSLNGTIYVQMLTHDGDSIVWQDIASSTGEALYIERLFLEREFRFRIYAELGNGSLQQIEIDMMRVVMAHQGTFDVILDEILGHNVRFNEEWLYYNFDDGPNGWWETYDDGENILQQSWYNYDHHTHTIIETTLNLESGTVLYFKQFNALETASRITWRVYGNSWDIKGCNWEMRLYDINDNYVSTGAQPQGGWVGNDPATISNRKAEWDWSALDPNLYISNDPGSTQHNWSYFVWAGVDFDGYAYKYIDIWHDLAKINVSLVGFDFADQDYPTIDFVEKPTFIEEAGSVFDIQVQAQSGHKHTVIDPEQYDALQYLVLSDRWDSGWIDMDHKMGDFWEAQVNTLFLDEPGNYTVFIKATDEWGLSTVESFEFQYLEIVEDSERIFVDIDSEYSNIHGFPYINNNPRIKLDGIYYDNDYDFELKPNLYPEHVNNLTIQTSRSVFGRKVLRIDQIPNDLCEISRLFIDANQDSVYEAIIEKEDIFAYFGIYQKERTLFMQYEDKFIENSYYDVVIEYTYSNETLQYSFFLDVDFADLVPDWYDMQVIGYNIRNEKEIRHYKVNIDYDGPVIVPLFNDERYLNSTSGQIEFVFSDHNVIDSFQLLMKQGGYTYLRTADYVPYSAHDFIGTSSGALYLINSLNRKQLLKSSDKGETWKIITQRESDITVNWYDYALGRIYFADRDTQTNIANVWYTTISDDSITELGTYSGVSSNEDLFKIGSYMYFSFQKSPPIQGYTYKKNIYISASKIESDLIDFPLMINITDSDLSSYAQADGDDICFFDVSGVQLDHEIELFYQTTGTLVVWVRVNVSSSEDTLIICPTKFKIQLRIHYEL